MMNDFDRFPYFGHPDKSRIGLLNTYQESLDKQLSQLHDYQHPLFSGTYSVDVFQFLQDKCLNAEPMEPQDVIDYMTFYFNNLPDWSYPGTMINVIPSVNILSAAISGVAEFFNPNCAQDTYSGNLLLAELEVIKYMSDLIGWDWTQSTGVFTFGGTGTNLYATKLAILNADPESTAKGVVRGKYFSITSKNGHPCHYQLCDWLGLGSDTCIEVPCTPKGELDIEKTAQIVRENLRAGKIFLGFNLTGGSTNEMLIDSIQQIFQLRESVVEEFQLNYRPMIHVDSVLGWVYLFFQDYDFHENPYHYSPETLKILKSLYQKVSCFHYADTIGIDFHKTGFCPYVTSLFLVRDKKKYFQLNPSKQYDIHSMGYGDYNPFYLSLEYSRSAKGPIAALTCLKSLGSQSFCKLIGDLTQATLQFRRELGKDPHLCIIDQDTEGFATVFSLIPKGLNIRCAEELPSLNAEEIDMVRELNLTFGKKIISDCVKQKTHFIFTASRSYTLPGTDIKIGALKAYPMSVFLDCATAVSLAAEIRTSISELLDEAQPFKQDDGFDLFHDMSRE